MDQQRFDAIAQALAGPRSRRATLGALLAGLVAPLAGRAAPESAACLANGQICGKRGKQGRKNARGKQRQRKPARPCSKCCSRYTITTNRQTRRCACKPEGKPCGNRAQCCSNQCRQGRCTACPEDTTRCSGGCVDLQTDPANCGTCGNACGPQQVCTAGTCENTCEVCESGCAFDNVQDAVDAAEAGATIRICAGTYVGHVDIAKSLTLRGAGTDTTTLDGDDAGLVVVAIAAGTTVVIRDLTVTRGGGPFANGGITNSGTLTLDGVTVAGNVGGFGAGGIGNSGTLILTNSRVTGNLAAFNGGGIYNCCNGTVALADGSRVTANSAGENGGGIYNDGGTVTIELGSSVTGNDPNNCAGDPVGRCVG